MGNTINISKRISEILHNEYIYYTFDHSKLQWGFKVNYEELAPISEVYDYESVDNFNDDGSEWCREWFEIVIEIVGTDEFLIYEIIAELKIRVNSGLDELNKTNDMKREDRYPEGYYPKLRYWNSKLTLAIENKDTIKISQYLEKIKYFSEAQHRNDSEISVNETI